MKTGVFEFESDQDGGVRIVGNAIGAHVRLKPGFSGRTRTLLGEVVGTRKPKGYSHDYKTQPDDEPPHDIFGVYLIVRFFNGEPWPIEPKASTCGVLNRR